MYPFVQEEKSKPQIRDKKETKDDKAVSVDVFEIIKLDRICFNPYPYPSPNLLLS